jgi:hypothetical protein
VAADARATVDEAAAGAQFVLGVSATATSFVSAVVDGERAVEREMKAGERELLIVHREVVLTAADAGAVALTLDGADAKPIGKSGDSATVRLDTSNFKDYLAPR